MRSSDNKFFAIKQLQYLRSCCRNAVSVMKYTCFLGANNHRLVVGACDPATVGEYLVPALSERQDRSQLVVATTSTRQPQFFPRPPPPPPTLQPQPQPALAVRQGLKQLDVEALQTKHVRLDTPLRCCRSLFLATTLTQPLLLQPPPLTRRRHRKRIDVEAPPPHVQLGISPLCHCRSLVLITTAARNRLPRPCCF